MAANEVYSEVASKQYTELQKQQAQTEARVQPQNAIQCSTPIPSQTPIHHPQMFTTLPPSLSSIAVSDNYAFSHAQSLSPVPTVSSTCSDPTMQSSFGVHLHPQNWLAPTSVPWDSLGSSVGHYGFETDVTM
jgi:hypothetical protein